MAWFKSVASSTPNPPNCSFVSAYGPSVIDTLPFFHLRVIAFRELWSAADNVTVLPQQIIVCKAIVHEGVLLALGHCLPLLLVKLPKADVFHEPRSCSSCSTF